MNYRTYRDNTHARQFDSPSKPRHHHDGAPPPPPPRNLLDDIDDVNNHGGQGSYGDDRVQNELLKEICGDIGIDEAMDLDLFDFDTGSMGGGGGNDYFFNPQGPQGGSIPGVQQGRLSVGGDLDFPGFGDLDGGHDGDTTLVAQPPVSTQLKGQLHNIESQNTNMSSHNQYSTSSYQTKIPSSSNTALEKGEFSPYSQSVPSVKSSVGEPHREVAIDSPTVSSSVPNSTSEGSMKSNVGSSGGGGNGGAGSVHSSVGSPSVHSTTPSLQVIKASVFYMRF